MEMGFFFLPSILLSGFMFPFRGMPTWAQWIGQIFPLTHFNRVVRGILLKGNGWDDEGNYPSKSRGNHVAIVDHVDSNGIVHVIDQWGHRDGHPHPAQARPLAPGEERRYSVVTRK